MKTCKQCGKELFDAAVICPQCGCPVEAQPANNAPVAPQNQAGATTPAAGKPAKNKKLIIIIVAALAVVLIVVAAIFIPKFLNQQKADELEESLIGKTFNYTEFMTYSYMSHTYKFKENNICELYSEYSSLDSESHYTKNYQIEYVSDDEIYLKIGYGKGDDFKAYDEFEIKLNSSGDKIVCFTDVKDSSAVYK